MKTRNIFFALACGLFVLASVNSYAEIKTQDRNTGSGFTKVSVSTAISLYLTQGNSTSVKVEADEEIIDQITTKVNEGKLVIKFDGSSNKKNRNNTGPMKVYVTMPSVEEISASAACSINLETPLTSTGEIDVKLSAACSMSKANITAKKVEVDINGASSMKNGIITADELDVEVSGASSASFDVKVTDLSVEASGASSVKLNGAAKMVEAEASGTSSIKAQDFKCEKSDVKSTGMSSIKLSKQ